MTGAPGHLSQPRPGTDAADDDDDGDDEFFLRCAPCPLPKRPRRHSGGKAGAAQALADRAQQLCVLSLTSHTSDMA